MCIHVNQPKRKLNMKSVSWFRAVRHHEIMIQRYKDTFSINGSKWQHKMIAHHKRLLAELNASKPPRYIEA